MTDSQYNADLVNKMKEEHSIQNFRNRVGVEKWSPRGWKGGVGTMQASAWSAPLKGPKGTKLAADE